MTQEEKNEKAVVSITEAAKLNNVTRQAIYVAIKLNKLKATKKTTRWTIHVDDLENYRQQKYSRSKSLYDGELLFDNKKGYYYFLVHNSDPEAIIELERNFKINESSFHFVNI